MFKAGLALLALVVPSLAWTIPEYVEERHVVQIQKRQADVSQLLQLYVSVASSTTFPTSRVYIDLGLQNPMLMDDTGPLSQA